MQRMYKYSDAPVARLQFGQLITELTRFLFAGLLTLHQHAQRVPLGPRSGFGLRQASP